MITLIILCTGVIVWGIAGFMLTWLLIECMIGFVCAVSFHRWEILSQLRKNKKIPWGKIPKYFLHVWWGLIGHRNNGEKTWRGRSGGFWRGIGDWEI